MKLHSSQQGFTLVEMIVSIAIFVIVAVVALGAVLKVIDANKKAQGLKTAVNNINFVMESMSRELRVGSYYHCVVGTGDDPAFEFQSAFPGGSIDAPQSCDSFGLGGGWLFAFYSTKPCPSDSNRRLIYAYFFSSIRLYKGEQADCNQMISFYPVIYGTAANSTDPNADESAINFGQYRIRVVTNDDLSGSIQPFAQIRFTGTTGLKEKNKTTFDIQTTVSQRLID